MRVAGRFPSPRALARLDRDALKPGADVSALRSRVDALTEQFPLYPGLEEW